MHQKVVFPTAIKSQEEEKQEATLCLANAKESYANGSGCFVRTVCHLHFKIEQRMAPKALFSRQYGFGFTPDSCWHHG